MFLSIAAAVYNKEKYLDKFIESVIGQEIQNFELILVDDGSSDRSLNICKSWEKKYPDIVKVFHTENQGSLLARRECIKKSSGKYIYLPDSDDYLVDKLVTKKIEDTIRSTGCDLLIFEMGDENGTCNFEFNRSRYFEKKEDLYQLIVRNASIMNNLANKVFSRDIVDKEDYRKYKALTNGTDYFQSIPLLSNAKRVYYLNQILYIYRNNAGSISHSFNINTYNSMKINYQRLVSFSKNWDIEDRDKFNHKLLARRMEIFSTSAYKVRFCSWSNRHIAYEYLTNIISDSFFVESYIKIKDLKISFPRRVILDMLHNKHIFLLYVLSRFAGRIRPDQ